MPDAPNVPTVPVMVDRITFAVLSLCECCWTGCDCGCAVFCPLPNHRKVGLSGGVKP